MCWHKVRPRRSSTTPKCDASTWASISGCRAGHPMKQGLSLRVSQHLALTPQLQQSIRLLQLSTLELSQEVEQMLDDNPFLEVTQDEAPREEFGVAQADTPAADDDHAEAAEFTPGGVEDSRVAGTEAETTAEADADTNWEGDGSTEVV